jgi:hypothetical protein
MMEASVALASVVTQSVLSEFELMKYTFERHHGDVYQWYLRTDEASYEALKHYSNVHLIKFSASVETRPDIHSSSFREIVAQKMNVIEDAYKHRDYTAVTFMDADLVTLAPFLDEVCSERTDEDILLSAHYFPATMQYLEDSYGIYNSGFLVVFNRSFSAWWRHAFLTQPELFADQACLNSARSFFNVGLVDQTINVGFWRSLEGYRGNFNLRPEECRLFHLHLFQPIRSQAELSQGALALTCLASLMCSRDPKVVLLYHKILEFDKTGFYRYVFDHFFDPDRPEAFVHEIETAMQNSKSNLGLLL